MIILPAIDIRAGKVVRLLQGDFTKETVYSGDPVNVAKRWEIDGAKMLHIVDLDGAYSGRLKNLPIVKQITSSIKVPVQLGGGLRTEGDVEQALSAGVRRIVIGTRAYADEDFIKRLVKRYPDSVAVSIDAVHGEVISEGWKKQTAIKQEELVDKLNNIGVKAIIYTDILKDGTMKGPNLDAIKDMLDTIRCEAIVSGGISSLDDIKALKELKRQNLAGAIVGKALYEGAFTLRQANIIAEGQ